MTHCNSRTRSKNITNILSHVYIIKKYYLCKFHNNWLGPIRDIPHWIFPNCNFRPNLTYCNSGTKSKNNKPFLSFVYTIIRYFLYQFHNFLPSPFWDILHWKWEKCTFWPTVTLEPGQNTTSPFYHMFMW